MFPQIHVETQSPKQVYLELGPCGGLLWLYDVKRVEPKSDRSHVLRIKGRDS